MPDTYKLLLKNSVKSWSPLILWFFAFVIPLWLSGVYSSVRVSWRQKVLQGYQSGPHDSICFSSLMSKTARSFLPAFTQRERDSLRHTEGIRQTYDSSIRAAVYHYRASSTTPRTKQERPGALSALCTAQGWCGVVSKHFLNDCDRVTVEAWGSRSLRLESLSQD